MLAASRLINRDSCLGTCEGSSPRAALGLLVMLVAILVVIGLMLGIIAKQTIVPWRDHASHYGMDRDKE